MYGVNYLLEALTTAAAADNVILQSALCYADREQLQEDIAALAVILQERETSDNGEYKQ